MSTIWETEFDMPQIGERIEGGEHIEVYDGGQSLTYHIQNNNDDDGMFVRIQSWKTLKERTNEPSELRAAHSQFAEFAGKRVRVIVQVIPPVTPQPDD